jgi:hypothetical protein
MTQERNVALTRRGLDLRKLLHDRPILGIHLIGKPCPIPRNRLGARVRAIDHERIPERGRAGHANP